MSADRISPPEEYPGPEGYAMTRLELEQHEDVSIPGRATLVPPSATGRPVMVLRTGCHLPLHGEVYVDVDWDSLVAWVDQVRAERVRLGLGGSAW